MNKWEQKGLECENCHIKKHLTRHHEKDEHGKKNGKTKILCRNCHNEIEEEYRREGRIIAFSKNKTQLLKINEDCLSKMEKDYSNSKKTNGIIPFFMKSPSAGRLP